MRYPQALAGLAMSALSVAVPATPAHAAAVFTGHGALCSLDSMRAQEPDTQSGTVSGGPFTAFDSSDPTVVPNPYIVCSVQVGGTGHHSDPDAAQVIAWEPGYVAYMPPSAVSFQVPQSTPVYVCSEIWIFTGSGHLTVYSNEANGGEFVTDPTAATCQLAAEAGTSYHAAARVV